MRNVYLSFLGLGSYNKDTGTYFYNKTVYELDGKQSGETEFVQVAEMQLLDGPSFDRVFIAATETSKKEHFENLSSQMSALGVTPVPIILTEEMDGPGQWEWFETILAYIEKDDQLTIDLTHGYRSIPIIFSTAINFLQKSKNIRLNAVYYGAFDKNRKLVPIVDMKAFYVINEWADAVSRLVDDADARKLAAVAGETSEFQVGELNDPHVIAVFEDLTNTVRNVDVNNVAKKANAALDLIREKKKSPSITGKMLLDLVIDKFVALTTDDPPSGRYDLPYFQVQINIIELLLEHKLYMQAYTVMREFVASMSGIAISKVTMTGKKGTEKRRVYGDAFAAMVTASEERWNFGTNQGAVDKLMPFYVRLKDVGIEPILRSFMPALGKYRNGFDHAWTARSGALPDIETTGAECSEKLKQVLHLLKENRLFDAPTG